jgi:hypothetical protein
VLFTAFISTRKKEFHALIIIRIFYQCTLCWNFLSFLWSLCSKKISLATMKKNSRKSGRMTERNTRNFPSIFREIKRFYATHKNTHFKHMNLNSTLRVKMFYFSFVGLKIDFEKKCTWRRVAKYTQHENNSRFWWKHTFHFSEIKIDNLVSHRMRIFLASHLQDGI